MKHVLFFLFGVLPHLITLGLAAYRLKDWSGINLYLGIALFVVYILWIFLESAFITVEDTGQERLTRIRVPGNFILYQNGLQYGQQ